MANISLLDLVAIVYPGATLSGRRPGHADLARLATVWLGALLSSILSSQRTGDFHESTDTKSRSPFS